MSLQEIDDILQLLDDSKINYYETPPGNFGFSMSAIWLEEKTQLDLARKLVTDYQIQRKINGKVEFEKAISAGKIKPLIKIMRENLFISILYSVTALIVFASFIYNVLIRI